MNNALIVTNLLPKQDYKITDGMLLKIVANPYHTYDFKSKYTPLSGCQMWEYVVALNGINNKAFDVRDLVVFHSFVSFDYTSYYYAENSPQITFDDEYLTFVADRSIIRRGDHRILDYSKFPVVHGSQYANSEPETQYIEYRKGIEVFSKLRSSGKDLKLLYELVHLYEFARHFELTHRIYRNANLPLSLYFTILESLIGRPKSCKGKAYCEACNREIQHSVVSIGEHFKSFFENKLQDVSKVRNSTYHSGTYFDFGEHISNVMKERPITGINFTNEKQWGLYHDKKMTVQELVRILLTSRFLKVYSCRSVA